MCKLYILSPSNYCSGGPELLAQLAYKINCLIPNSVKVYYPLFNSSSFKTPVPVEYFYYIKNEYVVELIDSEDIFLVIPESMVYLAKYYPKSKKIIWWLSVDAFYECNGLISFHAFDHYKNFINYFRSKIKSFLIFNSRVISVNYLKNTFEMHLVQSEYARIHLNKLKIYKIFDLYDYINSALISIHPPFPKENIILYNPKKGFDNISKIKSIDKINNWIALEGMNIAQLKKMFSSAKLYIDFGPHPGKYRMPREAVINGCILLTNQEGSAANCKDIPIENRFKINLKVTSNFQVLDRINYLLKNYDREIINFERYRSEILLQEKEFDSQVKEFLRLLHL
jgi:hypothetical protein